MLSLEPPKWNKCEQLLTLGDVFELMFQAQDDDRGWLYAGRYECDFYALLPTKHISQRMSGVGISMHLPM